MEYGQVPTDAGAGARDWAMAVLAEDPEDAMFGQELVAQPAVQTSRVCRWKVAGVSLATFALGATMLFVAAPCQMRYLFKASPLQLSEETQIESAARTLRDVKSKAEADKMVARALEAAKAESKHHKLAQLPPDFRSLATPNPYFHFQNAELYKDAKVLDAQARGNANSYVGIRDPDLKQQQNFRQAFCVFNAVETIDSIGGSAIDIEAIVHTCPEPRNDVGEFSCAVNSETLAEMVGSAATWLSNAVSSCGVLPSASAECGAAVNGIVSALGEIAASASLAMTSCKEYPLAGFRQAERLCIDDDCVQTPGTRMSLAGRQPGRRLFIGSGIGGMGVQCAVDVGFIVDNIYDSIFFIQQAANLDYCSKNVRYGPYNYLTGVPEAACAMDIAGAIAWITQIATFVEQLVSHCPDLLNLPTLCGSSATGMFSAVNQIASWGSGIAVSCASGESMTRVPATIVLADWAAINGREVEFVKLCSAALDGFGVDCEFVQPVQNDTNAANVELDLLGTRDGLLLAEAQIRMSGLQVPGFPTLTFVSREVLPIYKRRLEEASAAEREEHEQLGELARDRKKKWDPENHPKMKALRQAMRELVEVRGEFTKLDGEPMQNLTRANLQEKLHLIQPALTKGDLGQDTCQ
ncbi:BETAC-AD [Symbiodinium natans]|uniref:BETAC-AD protein n=1 Tax=Symbiodinium natans TaxID=878477 RepID=A0A812UU37_9DINO|nr:BETAC-AD [Symbiodinium natans]